MKYVEESSRAGQMRLRDGILPQLINMGIKLVVSSDTLRRWFGEIDWNYEPDS